LLEGSPSSWGCPVVVTEPRSGDDPWMAMSSRAGDRSSNRAGNDLRDASSAAPRSVGTGWHSKSMEEHIQLEGRIITVLAGTMFRVELDNKHIVLAHISGKMRKRFIRLTPGDRVRIEMSPYDLNKARITYRLG